MTRHSSRSARAISRSRGHLRQAEEHATREAPVQMNFSISKAQHALAVGILHERVRAADAAEALAAAQILQLDPEVLGIEPELEIATGDKVVAWLKRYSDAELPTGDEDDD